MKLLLLLVVTFFASSVYAVTEANVGFFIKNEMSDDDYINGVGTEVWLISYCYEVTFIACCYVFRQ